MNEKSQRQRHTFLTPPFFFSVAAFFAPGADLAAAALPATTFFVAPGAFFGATVFEASFLAAVAAPLSLSFFAAAGFLAVAVFAAAVFAAV